MSKKAYDKIAAGLDEALAVARATDPDVNYNDGFNHEVIHTTYILMDMLDRHVIETPCASRYRDIAKAAQKAHQALFDLYQLIGTKDDRGRESLSDG